MDLRFFRSTRLPAALNVVAVGASLAAMAAALLRVIVALPCAATGLSTFVVGCSWALLLRWPRKVRGIRLGWLLSVPLAALNAVLAGLVIQAMDRGLPFSQVVWVMVMMATLGAIVWVPALALTLLCFGAPLSWAQRLAEKGLAGRERGEWIVGTFCVALALLAVPCLVGGSAAGATTRDDLAGFALAVVALAAGGVSTALSLVREGRRRAFVRRVEAGEVPGFRVRPTAEGAALERMDEFAGYRVASVDEVVYLDERREAVRAGRA